MKHVLIDIERKESFIYSCKSDLARHLNVSVVTLWKWQRSGDLKHYKQFIICFNSKHIKAVQKANNQINNRM